MKTHIEQDIIISEVTRRSRLLESHLIEPMTYEDADGLIESLLKEYEDYYTDE